MRLTDFVQTDDRDEHTLAAKSDLDPRDFERWIQLTSHRESARVNRIARLARTIGAAEPAIALRIARLHDHKGFLTVVWAETPTDYEMRFVGRLWELVDHEQLAHVNHFVPALVHGDTVGDEVESIVDRPNGLWSR